MGIPGFFKWLTNKDHYSDITRNCIEHESSYDEHGAFQPLDVTQPNPNGTEFDNLYLDMNEIIHSSVKSDNPSKPKNEDEIIKSIFNCIDRIFSIVRPRKLLYIAIDGVAPRAKLNQQRSRRFLESKDALDKAEEIERIKSKILANNGFLPEEQNQKDKIECFDENCITPGTSFMLHLANCLRYYIYNRVNTNPAWRLINVILSDANVPGEGEHKIMNYIRQQYAHPSYNPETRHVLCGTDADLIILGLATHEHHITIMRPEFNPNKPRLCDVCQQLGHDMKECKGIPKEKLGQHNDSSSVTSNPVKTQYIFVDLSILREKLHKVLGGYDHLLFEWNFERFLDDWVFIGLLVGNDFLPNLPSFEIYENVIDVLMNIYMKYVSEFKDYLTDNGTLNMKFLEIILKEFGKKEDEIFKNRHKVNQQYLQNSQPPNMQAKPSLNLDEIKSLREKPLPTAFRPIYNFRRPDSSTKKSAEVKIQSNGTKAINASTTISSNSQPNDEHHNETKRETADSSISNRPKEDNDPDDPVRLWEEGWHERYYQSKFNVNKDQLDNYRMEVVQHYTQGLCWVLRYYYHGVPSWDWDYPYCYAPFASDFLNLQNVFVRFNKNSMPSKPLEQLICLLPPQCAKYLPEKWQSLILEKDSPIIDFYPTSFSVDSNGKRFKSQYIALLPFIDQKLLHDVLEKNYSSLTFEETKCNEHENDLLFIHSKNPPYNHFKQIFDANNGKKIPHENRINIPTMIEIPGHIWRDNNDDKIIPIGKTMKAPIPNYNNISNNQVMCVKYSTLTIP